MNKKIILSILMVSIMILFVPNVLKASSITTVETGTVGDFEYAIYIENGSYWGELTKYNGTSSNPTIPTKVNGYSIIKIGSKLFYRNKNLTNITIPKGITDIGEQAFAECSNLSKVTLTNGLRRIWAGGFKECPKITNITIPSTVTILGDSGYYKTGVFQECNGLTNVTIPKNVEIAGSLFRDCTNLKTITFENGMERIPDGILSEAYSPNLKVVIPNTVKEIGSYAFFKSYIKEINIPSSVTIIGDMAFGYCSGLTNITIPSNVTTLGQATFSDGFDSGVFFNCDGLTNVTIPKNVTTAGNLFRECSNLKTITIENGMKTIPFGMLANIKSPNVKINIPNTVTKISKGAFANSVMTNITIPNSVKTIEDCAFEECSNLTKIVIPSSVTTLGNESYDDANYFSDGYGVFNNCTGLREATISKNVEVAGNLFRRCSNLQTITIESGMKTIPYGMFANMTSPSVKINIPSTVTMIQSVAFYNSNITSITIPSSVKILGNSVFAYCNNISNISIPLHVSTLGNYAFRGWKNNQTINFAIKSAYPEWYENWDTECNAVIKYGKQGVPFNDVSLDSWYFDAVNYCYQNNIITGITETKFSPSAKLTRGMLASILYKMEGAPKVSGNMKFSDVAKGKYYYNAILWASQNKVVSGSNGKFKPNDYVTRQDLAVMLKNYANYKKKYIASNYGLTKYSDYKNISNYAQSAMRWAVKNKVINGSNGKLNPKGTATRAEAASMIYNYCNKIGR